jgi:hypothetical protein
VHDTPVIQIFSLEVVAEIAFPQQPKDDKSAAPCVLSEVQAIFWLCKLPQIPLPNF